MKHLIMWGSLIFLCVITMMFWDRISIMEIFDSKTSPIYVDVILLVILGSAFLARLVGLISKLL